MESKKKHLHHPKINPQTKKCWWSVKKYILLIIILISIEMPWKSTLLPSQGPRSPPPKNITKAGPHSIFLIAILISSNKLKILKIPSEMCHLLRKVWNAIHHAGQSAQDCPSRLWNNPPKKLCIFNIFWLKHLAKGVYILWKVCFAPQNFDYLVHFFCDSSKEWKNSLNTWDFGIDRW